MRFAIQNIASELSLCAVCHPLAKQALASLVRLVQVNGDCACIPYIGNHLPGC